MPFVNSSSINPTLYIQLHQSSLIPLILSYAPPPRSYTHHPSSLHKDTKIVHLLHLLHTLVNYFNITSLLFFPNPHNFNLPASLLSLSTSPMYHSTSVGTAAVPSHFLPASSRHYYTIYEYMLKSHGDKGQPCLTSFLTSNRDDSKPSTFI